MWAEGQCLGAWLGQSKGLTWIAVVAETVMPVARAALSDGKLSPGVVAELHFLG